MSGIKGATVLIGGGSEALDAIDGATLSDGDAARVTTVSGVYHYHLNASSGETENSPYVISPNTNPGTKRWILVTPVAPFSHVRATTTVAQSIADNTDVTIIYGTEEYDDLNEYDHTTGMFIPLFDGDYVITGSTLSANTLWASADFWQLAIFKDQAVEHYGDRTTSGGGTLLFSSQLSATLRLLVGEEIELVQRHNQGGAVALVTAAGVNTMTIDRIA